MSQAAVFMVFGLAYSVLSCGNHGHTHHEVIGSAERHMQNKQWLTHLADDMLGTGGHASHTAADTQPSRHLQQEGSLSSGLLAQLAMLRSIEPSLITQEQGTGAAAPAPAPIRIHVEYQNLQSLPSAKQDTLMAVTQAVIKTLQQHLSVRVPVQNTLLASPLCYQPSADGTGCDQYYPSFNANTTVGGDAVDMMAYCGMARINPSHVLNYESCQLVTNSSSQWECRSYSGALSGQATDLYLYVTANQDTQCNSGVAAWARPCLFDPITNRPTVGNANVCPYALMASDPDALVSLMVHEVIHALGFTNALFPLFIEPTNNAQLPTSSIVKTSVTPDGRKVSKIVTPSVVRAARALFNCDTLDGAQLEDEGGDGSAFSHWEYTHYQGEIMLATTMFSTDGEPARLSPLTLGLLEDSGWYVANWTAAVPLTWAHGTGCKLPTQGCQSLIAPLGTQGLFCDAALAAAQTNARFTCGTSPRSVGRCSNVPFSNGCGMNVARGGAPSCTLKQYEYANSDVFGWVNSPTSRCYPVTFKTSATIDGGRTLYVFPSTGNQGDKDAVCYPTTCIDGLQYINIGQQQIRCPTGQMVDLSTAAPGIYRQGMIGPCPDEAVTCASLDCGNQPCQLPGGYCSSGKCICRLGYSGDDCSVSFLGNVSGPPPTNASGGSTGSPGDSGSSPNNTNGVPPPPPALFTRNVTTWYQLIQVVLQLNASSLPGILAQSSNLASVLTFWADVNSTQGIVTDVRVLQSGNSTNATLSFATGAPSNILESQAAPESEGIVTTTTITHTVVSSNDWAGGAIDGSHRSASGRLLISHARVARQSKRARARKLAASTGAGSITDAVVQVTVDIRPANPTQSVLVMSKLGDASQVAALTNQLSTAGFSLVRGSLEYQLVIVQQTTTTTVPSSPGAQDQTGHAQDLAVRSASRGKSMSWSIVYIALGIGAGIIAIVGAATIIAVARSMAHAKAMSPDPQAQLGPQPGPRLTQPPLAEIKTPRGHRLPSMPLHSLPVSNQSNWS